MAYHRPVTGPRLWALCVAMAGVACGSGGSSGHQTSGGPAPERTKRWVVSLEIAGTWDAGADQAGTVHLAIIGTAETGSTKRFELGDFAGPCRVEAVSERAVPSSSVRPLLAAVCTGEGGVRLRAVLQRTEIVVLRAPGTTGDDPTDFDELQRIPVPPGAAISAEPAAR